MEPSGHTIVVVDDNLQDRRIHAVTLRDHGYGVLEVSGDSSVMDLVDHGAPDLFLISADMSSCDGFDLCRRLKAEPAARGIPVIFITSGHDPGIIDRAFAAGAVDTITRPCHLNEFLARVATHLELRRLFKEVQHLRELDIDANPLTHLPGNNSIGSAIQEALDEKRDDVVIYTDLDNFKAYNDAYGFSAGDDVLLFNAETLHTALRSVCTGQGFLGHVGGDDFVVLAPADCAEELGARIVRIFDEGVPNFYHPQDRERGSIVATDRQGRTTRFPLLSISMGGVRLRDHDFTRFVEVATACADVKCSAKKIAGSNLFMDRRAADRSCTNPASPRQTISR